MARMHDPGIGEPYDFPQPAAHPVTLDGVPDLFGNCEANAEHARIRTFTQLQDEPRGRRLLPAGRGQKVSPLPQSLHRGVCQALKRLRPRARRAESTRRPPVVAMRVRKPWRRLRTSLLG